MVESDIASPIAQKYLRLHLCRGIGAIRFSRLLSELGDIDRVLDASAHSLASVKGIGSQTSNNIARQRDEIDIAAELDRAGARGVRILCLADDDYPALLKRINDPPPCLYLRGTLQQEDAIALAIVGARHCSRYGAEQAERFGALAAGAGLTIVSGMARGVDSCAHHGALAADGRTLAVLGCGLDYLYPPESTELAERIAAHGALISELPMDIPPDPKNFPPRNRIITGLALGVLVIEAAQRSGALITARLGNEYNREVFALPGRVDMPHAEGCHHLIQIGGAKLVTRLEDILEELGVASKELMPKWNQLSSEPDVGNAAVSLTDSERRIIEILRDDTMSVEAICEESTLRPGLVATALTGLQLKGIIRRADGDLFHRVRKS